MLPMPSPEMMGLGLIGSLFGGGGGSRSSSASSASNSLNLSFNPVVFANTGGAGSPSSSGYATGSPSSSAAANSSGSDNPSSQIPWNYGSSAYGARYDVDQLRATSALGLTAEKDSSGLMIFLLLGVGAVFLLMDSGGKK